MASFQPKICLKGPRKRENKNCRSVPFRSNLMHNLKFQKNRKKFKKIEKYHCGFNYSQNRLEKAEKEGKQKLSFRLVLTRSVIENSKKIEKNF